VQSIGVAAGLGTLGTFEGSVVRLLARKLRRISKELTAMNQLSKNYMNIDLTKVLGAPDDRVASGAEVMASVMHPHVSTLEV